MIDVVLLKKGGNVSLTKQAGGRLNRIRVGLGWDARQTSGGAFDLDAFAIGVGTDGKVPANEWFVYYFNLESPGDAIVHQGDNRTGDGDGDDEAIVINLGALPSEIQKVIFPVAIYDEEHKVNFGDITNAFIRVVNDENGQELARFDLSEKGAGLECVVFGEVYLYEGDWKMRAIGQGYPDGMESLCKAHGVTVKS